MNRWQRPRPTGREVRIDAALAVGLAVAALATLELGRVQGAALGGEPPGALEQSVWALAITLPLALRRRLPLATLLIVAVLLIGLQARYVPEPVVSSVALYLALFTAGGWGRDRRRAAAVRTVVVIAMFAWLTYGLLETPYADLIPEDGPGELLSPRTAGLLFSYAFNAVYFAAAVAFGELAWRNARQRHELVERTRELEVERAEVARRTRETERLRIARDLHDVVAHHVSLMGVQAGAARRAWERRPEQARDALSQIELTSRTAVEEMRRMLDVLRDPASSVEPPAARVDGLPQLVDRVGDTGLQVALTVVGEPRDLPPAISASAYRVVQEALTNTVKHAGATQADVRLRYLPGTVEVEVVDDGRTAPGPTGVGSHGQVGMRERVALHAGELEVGPRPTGGYRVRARFPT